MFRSILLFLLYASPAAAWDDCVTKAKVSTTEIATSTFKITLKYCAQKQSDGTEDYKFLSGTSLIRGSASELSGGQMTLRQFPRNRCDYVKVEQGENTIYLAIGRYSKNCKTSEFGSWRIANVGDQTVPSAFFQKGKRPIFSKAKQNWR